MKTITVWQVKTGEQALSFFEGSLIEVFSYTKEYVIPFCVEAASTMILWRKQWIPVVRAHKSTGTFVVLQTTDPECPFIALATSSSPSRHQITDEQFSQLPTNALGDWAEAAISAISIDDDVSPIIDPSRLVANDFVKDMSVA